MSVMTEIALKTRFEMVVTQEEIREVVDGALRREAELASARCTHFERQCRTFEQKLDMTSEYFMQQFEAGALGDDAIYFDWYAAKRGFDLWKRRLEILSGVKA